MAVLTVAAFEKSESAIGQKVGSHRLIDSNGVPFKLEDYAGRPVVVSLVYTSCSSVCPTITQHLRAAVAQAQLRLGADRFAVVTLGFDARNDTPGRMASFRNAQNADLPGWRFASADAATMGALLRDLGFSYAHVAGGFDHVSQTVILDSNGRIHRQVYGEDFPVQVFMEPLKEAVFGLAATPFTVQGIVDRIRFICTVYDANVGHYRTSYAVFMGMGAGALSLLLTGWAIASAWRSSRLAREARDAARGGKPSPGAAG
jgi:protein SCO1/2